MEVFTTLFLTTKKTVHLYPVLQPGKLISPSITEVVEWGEVKFQLTDVLLSS